MLPSQDTILDDRGWLLRFNTGKSRNTNSVWPLSAPSDDLEQHVATCQRIYAERGLPCNFRLTELDESRTIESFLLSWGYEAVNPNIIMTRPVAAEAGEVVEIDPETWLDLVVRIDPDADREGLEAKRAALSNTDLPTWYTTLEREGKRCSAGRSIQQDDLYQLAELFTVENLRGQGLGTRLIHGLLNIGEAVGAHTAFLLVHETNTCARRLYERLGFQDAYRLRYMIPS